MLHHRFRIGRWLAIGLSLMLGLMPTHAQTQSRAGLVIQYPDGRVATHCVRFDEPSLTGLDLLNRSGVSAVVEVSGLGSAVCSIAGAGCAYPAQPCFCQCQGADCAYWNYFHSIDGAWRYSPIAASTYTVADGAVEGWAWGDGTAPPIYSIDQICAEPPVQPTIRPTPVAPTPAPSVVTEPTDTPASEAANPTTPPAPTLLAAEQPVIEPTTGAITPPELEPTAQPTDEPATDQTGAASADMYSYAVFALAVILLGGWLFVQRRRQR
jgi:hypothetical protein